MGCIKCCNTHGVIALLKLSSIFRLFVSVCFHFQPDSIMRSFLAFFAGSALSASFASATTVSPDASCGGTTGYTCTGSQFGSCCSQYGWCGSSPTYCDNGCQPGFGTCTGSTTTTLVTSTKTSSTPKPTGTSTLADCLGSKNVPVSFITSSNFQQLSKPYNLRLPYTPAVIVLPTTTKHVSDAVLCAAKSKVKVQVRWLGLDALASRQFY